MESIINGDCLEEMRKMEDNSISCIVTDPPYGLHFMGKDWDMFGKVKGRARYDNPCISTNMRACEAGRYDESLNDEFQQFIHDISLEALRIVKPGGHLLMFGAPRRYHRQICGLEDAGWEIRDCLMWIFGSGFPKSHNHFGIEGYGTALKPAHEPIIMAMKPCDGTFKQNAEKWGQAGINIDGCRIETNEELKRECLGFASSLNEGYKRPYHLKAKKQIFGSSKGRWPANIMFDEEAAKMLDEQAQEVSRFFYCAKTSSRERNEGLDGMSLKDAGIKNDSGRGFSETDPHKHIQYKNNHPTVKPLKLMEYLIKLVMPPKDGILLDPFAGSGSTIVAAHRLGLKAIGIEKSPDYCEIAKTRLDNVKNCVQVPELDLFNNCKIII